MIAAKPQLCSPFGVFWGPWWRKRGQVSFRHAVRREFVLEALTQGIELSETASAALA